MWMSVDDPGNQTHDTSLDGRIRARAAQGDGRCPRGHPGRMCLTGIRNVLLLSRIRDRLVCPDRRPDHRLGFARRMAGRHKYCTAYGSRRYRHEPRGGYRERLGSPPLWPCVIWCLRPHSAQWLASADWLTAGLNGAERAKSRRRTCCWPALLASFRSASLPSSSQALDQARRRPVRFCFLVPTRSLTLGGSWACFCCCCQTGRDRTERAGAFNRLHTPVAKRSTYLALRSAHCLRPPSILPPVFLSSSACTPHKSSRPGSQPNPNPSLPFLSPATAILPPPASSITPRLRRGTHLDRSLISSLSHIAAALSPSFFFTSLFLPLRCSPLAKPVPKQEKKASAPENHVTPPGTQTKPALRLWEFSHRQNKPSFCNPFEYPPVGIASIDRIVRIF